MNRFTSWDRISGVRGHIGVEGAPEIYHGNFIGDLTLSSMHTVIIFIQPVVSPVITHVYPALFGLPPPLCFFPTPFSAPPSVSPLCFDTSGFAGETSKGFPYSIPKSASKSPTDSQRSQPTSVSFPAISFSFCGSVVLGSKAASSCFAAPSSVPLFEYSVASVSMLSLS